MRPATGIGPREYAQRRRQLMQAAGDGAIVIVPAAPERLRNGDASYPYRQDSDFWYLCGFPEPEAVLVLVPGRAHGQVLLFCRERDRVREAWDGPRIGPEGAVARYGMDDAYPIEDLDEILPGLLEGRPRVFCPLGRDAEFDRRLIAWVRRAGAQQVGDGRQGIVDLGRLLDEQRLFKSAAELALLRQAGAISVRAHQAALLAVADGVPEYVLQAEIEREFRAADGWPAYPSIVAAGANACVLHYRANAALCRAGELVLVDAGGEYRGYAGDISRTFPVDGHFRREQRQLHDLVVRAHAAARAQVRPGLPFARMHEAALAVLVEGLLQLGLLRGSLQTQLASGDYRRFCPHKTGHWLGLDVHDVGDYRIEGQSRLLETGMVFTIEPGLYVRADDATVDSRWRGIGIRIEDDVAVTEAGSELLTPGLARSAEEIEAFMAAR